MRSSSSTEFTISDGRRFAFPVAAAFMALAALLWWRDNLTVGMVAAGLGGALLVAGLVMPAQLGPVYRAWMRMALAISMVTTPVFMGIVYFFVFTPAGILMRLLGKRPIVHSPERGSSWQVTTNRPKSELTRQF